MLLLYITMFVTETYQSNSSSSTLSTICAIQEQYISLKDDIHISKTTHLSIRSVNCTMKDAKRLALKAELNAEVRNTQPLYVRLTL